jgi:hypothetical protein
MSPQSILLTQLSLLCVKAVSLLLGETALLVEQACLLV